MITDSRAYRYARQCADDTSGRVGKYVKLQCREWLDIADGKSDIAEVSEQEYKRLCGILQIMVHPDLLTDMFHAIEDYAMFFLVAVFCTKRRDDDRRLYTTALLEISRKNYKTFNAAIAFIISMLTEQRFSRLFSVAPDYKLSSELRLAVRKIIKVSPLLEKHFKITRDMITCKLTDNEYTPLAYSNDRMDGKLATVFLADEAGALDSYPVEAMRSSQINIKNKLGIIISTQYPNENNVLIDEIDKAKKSLDRVNVRQNYFAMLYEPDEELIPNWQTDDNVIYQSNPVAVNNRDVFDSIAELRADAIIYENSRENYLCKHNNIHYKGLGTEGYVDIEKVKRCETELPDEWWRGRRVYIGLDLSQTEDNTSVAMVTLGDDGYIYAKVWGFIPAARVQAKSEREGLDYRRCIAAGECFPCGDEIIGYDFVEAFILGIAEKYGVEVVQLGFDRWNALSSVQKLEAAENPIECVEIKQHSSVLHPATKLLREYILSNKFRTCKSVLLENNFENARCTEDTNRNKYVNKKRSNGKVDMVVSLINATYILMQNEILGDDFLCYYS